MSVHYSSRIGFFLLGMLLVALLLTVFYSQQQQQTKQYAAGLGKDLYGIAAGSVMDGLSTTDITKQLDGYKAVGASWIRFDFSWILIQPTNAPTYNWTRYDTVVAAANAHGLKVLGTIFEPPAWAASPTCTNTDPRKCPPANPATYAAFAAAVVAHYAPMGVHYWEIWNEPNISNFWDKPDPAAYTQLLKAAYPAIKQTDPAAFVLTGGISPAGTDGTNFSPPDFLNGIYQNGGKGYFDAVADHPYCYNSANCPSDGAWSQMQDTNPSLRSIMTANGDQNKQIWATEFGTPTGGRAGVPNEAQQAQMVTNAYTLFSSYSWAGPLFWYTYKDSCTDTTNIECYFGVVHTDYSQKPAYNAYQALAVNGKVYSTCPALSNGSSGSDVITLQILLNKNGANLVIDGSFGPITQAAVQTFQSSKGLSATGIVGTATWIALGVQCTNVSPIPSTKPTPTNTLTPTTQPPGATTLSLTLLLHGIGNGGDSANPHGTGNMNPGHPQRIVTVSVYNGQNMLVNTTQATITYDSSSGAFKGSIILGGSLSSGAYLVKVKTDQYLRAQIPGIQNIIAGQINTLPQVSLISGDINGDNEINIIDYNILMGCYSDLLPAINCNDSESVLSDLNDDGKVNAIDYNLFIRELSTNTGQ